MLEPVDKVGGVKKAECQGVEIILLLEVGDRSPDKFNGIAGRNDDRDPARQVIVL